MAYYDDYRDHQPPYSRHDDPVSALVVNFAVFSQAAFDRLNLGVVVRIVKLGDAGIRP